MVQVSLKQKLKNGNCRIPFSLMAISMIVIGAILFIHFNEGIFGVLLVAAGVVLFLIFDSPKFDAA
jgi:hypothetical protein